MTHGLPLAACTRMYDATPKVASLWKDLIGWVSRTADVPMEMIHYPAPFPLDDLWARDDMGGVLMCGWPFRRANPRPRILAALIPADPRSEGRPEYCTDLIVKADAPFQIIEDTFGGTLAWTIKGSHSGYNSVRHFLLRYRDSHGERLFKKMHGPVITPLGAIESVFGGKADIAPLDSYFHLLLKKHRPEITARFRVIAHTDFSPVPVFVAAHSVPKAVVERLRKAMEQAFNSPKMQPVLQELQLQGLTRVADPEVYALPEDWALEAEAAGYSDIA